MIYRECYSLLRFGRNHAASLVAALGMLAGVSDTLSLFAKCPPQPTSSQLQQYPGQVLDRILDLINCLTGYFQDLPVGSGNITGLSGLRCSLGKSLEAFDLQVDQLLNEIWTHHIPSSLRDVLVNFKQVQLLLQPRDKVVRTTQKILHAERGSRHEFTCEWFSKPFLDFVRSSDAALWIDGRIGCGKSVLCGWILESLQSAVDGKEYAPIAYSIDPQLPSETSTTSVLKALLRQMVERQYQSRKLYEALAHLMGTVGTGDIPVQIEQALCGCLETAIGEANQPTMLVIDGLSELDGGEAAAAALFNTLLRFAASNPLVRLMVLSRPFAFSPGTSLRRRTTEAEDVRKDICKVITELVPTQSATPAAEVARRIEHEAHGNFFWSLLAFQEWSATNFSQQAWRTLPVSLEANVVSKLDFLDPMTSIILFNSIIATRPLRLVEMEVISRLDVHNRLLKPQSQDMLRVIENACGSVLVVQDGIVLFRHALVKQALLDMLQFKDLLLGPEMHADMACRLLLYIKLVSGQRSELTLKLMPSSALEDLFHAHPLLAYSLQYWTKHLVSSSMFPEPGSFKPNSDCSIIFPDTVQAAIVEASYWKMDPSIESIRALQTATAIRKDILGDHEATLETTACLAEAFRLRSDFTGAANYFYVASEIAQVALPEFHSFTATCMLQFLDVADDSEIPDHASRKANVLRYMISMYDTQSGPSSDQAVEARNSLAIHYSATQEHALSAEMYRVMHRLTVDRHGKESNQARGVAEKLVTALQYQSEGEDNPYSDSVYDDILQTYEVTDPRRIKASISKAEAYRSLDDPANAELIYVNLWYGVAETCHLQRSLKSHEKLLQCGVVYSKFLREYGRMSDSQNVVLGLWSQQQASGYHSSTISALLMEVASEMKHAGLQDMALDILYAVLDHPETQDSHAISKAISDTSIDMVSNAHSSSNEAALQRILEAKKSQGLAPDDVPLVNALIKKFLDCGRFDDVVAIGVETLHRLWPSVLDNSYGRHPVDPASFNPALANIATSLAHAYSRSSQSEDVGLIYWHLFHEARHSETVDDSTAVEYGNVALAAFEENGQVHRMITLREDLVNLYVARDGERHSKTIEARYALASLCSQDHQLDKARQQYTHIIDNLKQPTFYESAALPALRRLIEIYSGEKRWDDARATYAALWDTFLSKALEFGFDPSTSKALYEGYSALLKKQDVADFGRLHKITEQYRSVCSALWGDQHSVTMKAVLCLADIELSLQRDSIKAMQLYESIIDRQEGIIPDQQDEARATIEAAEDRLTDLYRVRINDGRNTTARTSPLQGKSVARAVRLVGRKYQREKIHWGTSQPATLSTLATLVSVLSQDSRSVAIRELESAIHSLMESDLQPTSIYNAAVLLATTYSSNGFTEEGLNTVRNLTERVIFDQHAGRSRLVFLAAFEAHLIGSVMDFAEVHAKILKVSALWENYQKVSQGPELSLTLASGARLRSFLMEHDSPERGTLIEGDLYNRFLHNYGGAFAQGIQTVQDFFFLLLEELSSERSQSEIPDIPSIASAALNNRAGSLLHKGEYMAALNLLLPGLEFLYFVEGFANNDHSVLKNIVRLGLMLAVPSDDQDISDKMLSLSKTFLQETLQQCRSQHLDLFDLVEIGQVSRVASVLGIHKSYEDLEVSNCTDQSLDVMVY